VFSSPVFGGRGYTLACGRRGEGVPIPARGQTLWYCVILSIFLRGVTSGAFSEKTTAGCGFLYGYSFYGPGPPTFLPVSAEFEIPLANFYLQFSVIANLMQIITQNMIKKIHVAMQSKLTLKICKLYNVPGTCTLKHNCTLAEAEFLDVIGTKFLRLFLLAIHSHLY
jgi:hypothetical protein